MTLKHTITRNIANNIAGSVPWLLIGGFHYTFQETTLMLLIDQLEGLTHRLSFTLEKYV